MPVTNRIGRISTSRSYDHPPAPPANDPPFVEASDSSTDSDVSDDLYHFFMSQDLLEPRPFADLSEEDLMTRYRQARANYRNAVANGRPRGPNGELMPITSMTARRSIARREDLTTRYRQARANYLNAVANEQAMEPTVLVDGEHVPITSMTARRSIARTTRAAARDNATATTRGSNARRPTADAGRSRSSNADLSLAELREAGQRLAQANEDINRSIEAIRASTRRRARSPDTSSLAPSEDEPRRKRRRTMDRVRWADQGPLTPAKKIEYGYYGQVYPGKLNLRVSHRHTPVPVRSQAFLYDNRSHFTSIDPEFNLVLELNEGWNTTFSLESLVIKAPRLHDHDSLQQGLAFVAMHQDDGIFVPTLNYKILHFPSCYFGTSLPTPRAVNGGFGETLGSFTSASQRSVSRRRAMSSRASFLAAEGRRDQIESDNDSAYSSVNAATRHDQAGTDIAADSSDEPHIDSPLMTYQEFLREDRHSRDDLARQLPSDHLRRLLRDTDRSLGEIQHDLEERDQQDDDFQRDLGLIVGQGEAARADRGARRQNPDSEPSVLRGQADDATNDERTGRAAAARRNQIERSRTEVRQRTVWNGHASNNDATGVQYAPDQRSFETMEDEAEPSSASSTLKLSLLMPAAHFHLFPEEAEAVKHEKGTVFTNTLKFDPPLSGTTILLKFWSPKRDGHVDIQYVEARGFVGPQFFPACERR